MRFFRLLRVPLATLLMAASATAATPPLQLEVRHAASELTLVLPAELPAGAYALNIHSDRNAAISRWSDVSPLQPPESERKPITGVDCWYPVIDLKVTDDMSGVLTLTDLDSPAALSWNGWLRREKTPAALEHRIESSRLLAWENTVWIEGESPDALAFHLHRPIRADELRDRAVALQPLSANWSGRIELVRGTGTDAVTLAEVTVPEPIPLAPKSNGPAGHADAGFSRERLLHAVAGAITYTLHSQVSDQNDPMHGGLYVFYDLDAQTYRSSHWAWAWGPSAGLLLAARDVPELTERFSPASLLAAAEAIGHAALRTVPDDPGHPARGIPLSRWDRSPRFDYGHRLAFTPCDAGFLAAWTWVRLYEATGNPVWRDATGELTHAIDRLMQEYPVPPQNYWPDEGEWDVKVIDEAGFGVELFAEQYRLTGDNRMRELGRRYMDQHLAALGREDGLWDREHYLDGRPNKPTIRMTRGLGWPMEGLLAAHRLMPDEGEYLELAVRMADHLLRAQQPEGYWLHRYEGPAEKWGIGMKGTALWCWLFYELHRHTGNPEHLAAARRALNWLLEEQYFGEDPHAYGGHLAVSPHSAVGYRPWFRVACSYGSAYFGMAVLEELRLQALAQE